MSQVIAIKNAKLVLENGILEQGILLVKDGKIAAVGKDVAIPESARVVDAQGAYVGPGFVDIHIHGAGKAKTYEDPKEAAAYVLRHGETTILATPSYSLDFEHLMAAIKCVREAMKEIKTIKGLYLEGPYTNPKYGANSHKNPWRRDITPEEFQAFVDAAGEDAVVWTVAPERPDLKPFLAYARKVKPNVIFSLGHSEATPDQIRALGEFTPTIQTHCTDATGSIQFTAGTWGVGPDVYCLKEPNIYCEMISDSMGIHVHPEVQQLILHCKGVERVVLITDCAWSQGGSPSEYAHIHDLAFDSKGGLSGSKLTLDAACRNVMKATGCSVADAFLMASTNPAKAIGFYDRLGSIAEGKLADLVFVDEDFTVLKVMQEGNFVEEEEQ